MRPGNHQPFRDMLPEDVPRPDVNPYVVAHREFGDEIVFAGTNRRVTSVTVTMSAWALHATYPTLPAAGWTHPITLNLYATNPLTPTLPGALIESTTQTFAIPWRVARW